MSFASSVRRRFGWQRATAATPREPRARPGPRRRANRRPPNPGPILPWYLIFLGVAVAASTSAAQQRAVELMTVDPYRGTDPLPDAAPDWMKSSRRARSLWTIVSRVADRMSKDNLTLVAAGIAFYAMFAVFPGLGALVSIFGLFGDTHIVQAQVQQLTVLLPYESAKLLNDSLNALLSKPSSDLNFGLVVGFALALWGTRAGTLALMTGLNVACERPEARGVLEQNVVALLLAFGGIVFAIFALTAVAIIPIVLDVLPVDATIKTWLANARWPVLGVFILLALDVAYRFGPSLAHPTWRLLSVGTIFAGVIWIFGSWAFSVYVTKFGSYDATYGSLGAVVVLLLWFWMSALIVLLGATIDSVRVDMKR